MTTRIPTPGTGSLAAGALVATTVGRTTGRFSVGLLAGAATSTACTAAAHFLSPNSWFMRAANWCKGPAIAGTVVMVPTAVLLTARPDIPDIAQDVTLGLLAATAIAADKAATPLILNAKQEGHRLAIHAGPIAMGTLVAVTGSRICPDNSFRTHAPLACALGVVTTAGLMAANSRPADSYARKVATSLERPAIVAAGTLLASLPLAKAAGSVEAPDVGAAVFAGTAVGVARLAEHVGSKFVKSSQGSSDPLEDV